MSARAEATGAQQRASRPDLSSWVSANAGSGKTTVLTSRVARLLLRGCRPERILCLTYTKAAAAVMQSRLFKQLGEWALLPEPQLRENLEKLGETGDTLTTDVISRARTLFAAALETPGGLKIQTIHAFCDAILRRFPLEAGISPDFMTLDASQQRQIFDDVLRQMALATDTAPLDDIAAHLSAQSDSMTKIAQRVLSHRFRFRQPFDEAAFRRKFGLEPDSDDATLFAQVAGPDLLGLLKRMCAALAKGSGNDLRDAAKLARIGRFAGSTLCQPMLESHFLFGSGKRVFSAKIDEWAKKDTVKAHTSLTPLANELALRLEAARPVRLALQTLESTRALYSFGRAFLVEYDRQKAAADALDFDDQVNKVSWLLENGEAAQWVLYKLDGGVSHILVDEAQDTNPEQWRVVNALSDEFFAGAGAHSEARTIFAVGDEKQSIYSFQGAEPDAFAREQRRYGRALEEISGELQECDLLYSFRSAEPVLRLVDQVMASSRAGTAGKRIAHLATDPAKPGRVELWPKLAKEPGGDAVPWYLPDDMVPNDKPLFRLADEIADWIAVQLEQAVLPNGNTTRALRPGDILILVRRRSAIFHALMRAMKSRNLPFSGSDRFKLQEDLAVKDLLAVLAFVSTPFDDLSLAAALRSPLCGLSEADLFALARDRNPLSLWQSLLQHRARFPETVAMFEDLRAVEGFARPYDLLEMILTRHGGRRNLTARLGSEASEGIDELLAQALAYESGEPPSLTGFLEWVSRSDEELKREQGESSDLIRMMTIHGAKGLESPMVILPDTGFYQPREKVPVTVMPDDELVFHADGSHQHAKVQAAIAEAAAKTDAEQQRLLYVALTRAEHWLVVCGAESSRNEQAATWYSQIEQAMRELGSDAGSGDLVLSGNWPQQGRAAGAAKVQADVATLPGWLTGPLPEVPDTPAAMSPSTLGGPHALAGETVEFDEAQGKVRGDLIHRLLEQLPAGSVSAQRQQAGLILAATANGDPGPAGTGVIDEAILVRNSPGLQHVFAESALAEVPLAVRLDSRPLAGRIDRLIVAADKITAIDFKSNRVVPGSPAEVPQGILRQMGAYARALAEIWPGRQIETCILWTRSAELMVLPQNLVIDAFSRRGDP